MTLKDQLDKTVNDVKDAVSEAQHRASAEAEKTRRDVDGDNMTVGQKVGSVANEAVHRTQAELDKTKREVRDNT